MKIAVWSGPRNLSTALMYSFANRADCAACDEPFYAAYLKQSGIEHPMREAILVSQSVDPLRVACDLTGPPPNGRMYWYQKLMCHHMCAGFPLTWMGQVKNVFLIRHPARVVASYQAKRAEVTLADIGLRQQIGLYEYVRSLGQTPSVIDADDILRAPEAALRALCAALKMPFDAAMMSWPQGPKTFDGPWAAHWYGQAHQSTGFAPFVPEMPSVTGHYADLVELAMPLYRALTPTISGREQL
ncbi:MAG: HAD family hydrolase [Pseudomonadota bacterium]